MMESDLHDYMVEKFTDLLMSSSEGIQMQGLMHEIRDSLINSFLVYRFKQLEVE